MGNGINNNLQQMVEEKSFQQMQTQKRPSLSGQYQNPFSYSRLKAQQDKENDSLMLDVSQSNNLSNPYQRQYDNEQIDKRQINSTINSSNMSQHYQQMISNQLSQQQTHHHVFEDKQREIQNKLNQACNFPSSTNIQSQQYQYLYQSKQNQVFDYGAQSKFSQINSNNNFSQPEIIRNKSMVGQNNDSASEILAVVNKYQNQLQNITSQNNLKQSVQNYSNAYLNQQNQQQNSQSTYLQLLNKIYSPTQSQSQLQQKNATNVNSQSSTLQSTSFNQSSNGSHYQRSQTPNKSTSYSVQSSILSKLQNQQQVDNMSVNNNSHMINTGNQGQQSKSSLSLSHVNKKINQHSLTANNSQAHMPDSQRSQTGSRLNSYLKVPNSTNQVQRKVNENKNRNMSRVSSNISNASNMSNRSINSYQNQNYGKVQNSSQSSFYSNKTAHNTTYSVSNQNSNKITQSQTQLKSQYTQNKARSQTNTVRKPQMGQSEAKSAFTSANKSPKNSHHQIKQQTSVTVSSFQNYVSDTDNQQTDDRVSIQNSTTSTESTETQDQTPKNQNNSNHQSQEIKYKSQDATKTQQQEDQPMTCTEQFSNPSQNNQELEKQNMSIMKPVKPFIVLGLKNIGNTCYMNSILQCAFATQSLTDYMLNGNFRYDYEHQVRPILLGKDYYYLLNAIQNAKQNQGVAVPQDLKLTISRKSPQFRSSRQQDAQEFLRCFLDQLDEELNRVKDKPPYQEVDFDNLSLKEQSEKWWQYYKARENSPIQDIFEGQLYKRTQCQLCGYESHKFDNFMDISVPLPQNYMTNQISQKIQQNESIKLQDCLNEFIKEEDMEKCGYKCSKCKKEDNFKNQMTVWKFPSVLVIHLKRFQYNLSWKQKLNTKIDIPIIIDMSPFAPYSSEVKDFHSASYNLYGISHHFGSLQGGHYTAQTLFSNIIDSYYSEIKSPDGRWFNCNDSLIEQIKAPDVNGSESAYLLFYSLLNNQESFNQKL